MAETAAGLAAAFSELITALVSWFVAKLRGHDLFDQLMRNSETEAEQSGTVSPTDS
jgi:hypothetical protein